MHKKQKVDGHIEGKDKRSGDPGAPGHGPAYPKEKITGVVLAGGRANRMGGVDKGLIPFAGRPLAGRVAGMLAPQVGALILNANRNRAAYGRLGYPVIPDTAGDFLGPLAGMARAMEQAETPYVVAIPCDSPFIVPDLVAGLYGALADAGAEIGVAHDGERMQPVFALLKSALRESAMDFLRGGGRRVGLWYARHRVALADFSHSPSMFQNINTPEDAKALETGSGWRGEKL